MATPTNELRTLSVCSGAGGLELGLRIAGLPTRVVGYVEREVSVVDILASRFEDGTLDPAPVWSDVRTAHTVLDAFGRVDAIVGGYPCQPFSHAGRRAGADDPRHLWPAIRDLVERIDPTLCVFENVDGHVSKGLDVVIGDLEDLGYVVEPGIFSAAEVGAPHLRKRLFIVAVLADSDTPGRGVVGSSGLLDRFRPPLRHDPDGQSGTSVADAPLELHDGTGNVRSGRGRELADECGSLADGLGARLEGRSRLGSDDEPQRPSAERGGPEMGHAASVGRSERGTERTGSEGRPEPTSASGAVAHPNGAERRSPSDSGRSPLERLDSDGQTDGGSRVADATLALFPPGPEQYAEWESVLAVRAAVAPALPDLAVRSVAKLFTPESVLRRMADGLADWLDDLLTDRPHRLQALGNGVVPQCAGVAVSVLLARIARRIGDAR